MGQQQQAAKTLQRLHEAGLGLGIAGKLGLVHLEENQQPGQRTQHRQQRKAGAPTHVLHQPGHGRAGKQQAQPAQTQAYAREVGKFIGRKMARDEHGAGQKGGRAAHADQQLTQHQPGIAGCECGQRGARNRQRKGQQHGAAQPIDIHAYAHEQLGHAEGQRKQPGKRSQRLRGQAEVRAQTVGDDGGDGSEGLAQSKASEQADQHGPGGRVGLGAGVRRSLGGAVIGGHGQFVAMLGFARSLKNSGCPRCHERAAGAA